jgi:hypothetical protein
MRVEAENQLTEFELDQAERNARAATRGMNASASAAVVNRTHRVVRARASRMQDRRSKVRSLWIPLGVSAALLAVLACALWTAFADFEASPAGLPDSSQMLVLLMWSLPISVMVLAVVWFRRSNSGANNTENESAR